MVRDIDPLESSLLFDGKRCNSVRHGIKTTEPWIVYLWVGTYREWSQYLTEHFLISFYVVMVFYVSYLNAFAVTMFCPTSSFEIIAITGHMPCRRSWSFFCHLSLPAFLLNSMVSGYKFCYCNNSI